MEKEAIDSFSLDKLTRLFLKVYLFVQAPFIHEEPMRAISSWVTFNTSSGLLKPCLSDLKEDK